jgi:hypothetical protein
MDQPSEQWRVVTTHYWNGWNISKDKGWFSIGYDSVGQCWLYKFRYLSDAKQFCKTLEGLADWGGLDRPQYDETLGNRDFCERAMKHLRLDNSRRWAATEP